MVIKITRNTLIDGTPVAADAVVETDDKVARALISMGKAVIWSAPVVEPEAVETAEERHPLVENAMSTKLVKPRRRKR
jgi:hypothetical protein